MHWRVASWRPAALAAAMMTVSLAAASGAALAASPFAGLRGSWSGSGHVLLDGGRREAIRCSANYVARSGGRSLGLALRCASASNRVELRASLAARGSHVSGSWEERSFGVSGGISGTATGNHLRLSFNGGLSGAMVVNTHGASQSISVRTDASALKGVNVSLRRR